MVLKTLFRGDEWRRVIEDQLRVVKKHFLKINSEMFQAKTFCMANGTFVMIFVPLLNEPLALSDLKTIISQRKRRYIYFQKCSNKMF